MSRAALLLPALLSGLALLASCGDGARRYEARGVVREVRPDWKQVVIAHDEIPGLMPAMTMNFDVEDAELLARLERGQAIDFTVESDERGYRVVRAELLGEGEAGDGASLAHLLPARAPAPDFTLTDQSGAEVSLASLRGRLLVVDFVYTRCPGPCPALTARHVKLQRALPAALRERTHFVSISIDPRNDSPEALRAYAEARGADLSTWSFLTGPPAVVDEVLRGFGVGSSLASDGEIEHTIVTFLVDAQGRIAELYTGFGQPNEVVIGDLERIAAG